MISLAQIIVPQGPSRSLRVPPVCYANATQIQITWRCLMTPPE